MAAKKVDKKQNVTLSPPWTTYYRKLVALFNGDEDVKIEYDNGDTTVSIYVEGEAKADAIERLLPKEVDFGNVTLTINVVPANTVDATLNDLKIAFAGNKNVTDIVTTGGGFGTFPMTYVVFKKEVIQFFNDDLTDLHGLCSTLNEDIAKEVFGDINGVCFCTDDK